MNQTDSINQLTRADVDSSSPTATLAVRRHDPRRNGEYPRGNRNNVLATDGPNPRSRGQSRHMDQRVVYDLATHPAIIDRIAGILGPDLVIWATNIWNKAPAAPRFPGTRTSTSGPGAATQHLRLDRHRRGHGRNSCVQIVPGSHRRSLPHTKAEDDMAFGEMADPLPLTPHPRSIWNCSRVNSSSSANVRCTGRAKTGRTNAASVCPSA